MRWGIPGALARAGKLTFVAFGVIAFCGAAQAQVTFLSDSLDREFPGPEPVCVHDSGASFGSGANDCTDTGGESQINGLQVGDSAKAITIDTVGPQNVGILTVGSGTHTTTLDGSNGNVNVGGTLNVELGASMTMDSGVNVNFGGNVLHNIGTPTAANDAANKAYVNSVVNGGNKNFDSLTVTGVTNLNGGVNVTGASHLNGDLTVTGVTNLNGDVGVGGDLKVAGTQTVTGQSFLNGGATVKNNLTVSGPADIDMGGNIIHNVAAPVADLDAANKAYVDEGLSSANRRIDKADQGVAIALALEQPIFQPGQNFAVRGGWGNFESQNAFGLSAAGVLSRDVWGSGTTAVLDAGVGFATERSTIGGKAGVTFGW